MDRYEMFRLLAGLENDPRSIVDIWESITLSPGFVNARDCGLVDAVQSGWYLNDSNELFRGVPIGPDDSVLDFGCGGGGATMFCASRGAHVAFADSVPEKVASLLERVKQTSARGAEGFVTAEAKVPLANASMSRVLCLEVLEHVPEPSIVLAELVRVGQPDALFLLSVPDPAGEKIQKEFAPPFYFEAPNHIHIFEREAFARLVTDAGLEIVEHAGYGFFWTLWMSFYWVLLRNKGIHPEGEAFDLVQPPYPPLLNDWTRIWHQIIKMPESAPLKQALDRALPKSQVIVARKPLERFL
jgi:2-polyprenyl-3-methyl-5-hydroxy-6-metoxy-1,4-benzoquinol methylase